MALAPEELAELQRAAFGRSSPEERAAAEARLAELEGERSAPAYDPPALDRPPRWRGVAVVAGLLSVVALVTASITVWTSDSRRVFDRPAAAADEVPWAERFLPTGGTVRWLGEFVGRDVYGTLAPDGSVCVVVPLAGGQLVAACEDALAFTQHGVGLVSRTIEGDFSVVWGPTGGARWGEFPRS